MVMGNNKSATTKMRANHWQIYCHADAAIQHGAHRLIEHIQGFTWSHWMPPLGECLCLITPAVKEFVETTLITNQTQLLASKFGTFWSRVVCENFIPQNEPSTQLINATSCIKMWNVTMLAYELADISSYQSCEGTKIGEVIKQSWSSI